jgi:hypothetical protein
VGLALRANLLAPGAHEAKSTPNGGGCQRPDVVTERNRNEGIPLAETAKKNPEILQISEFRFLTWAVLAILASDISGLSLLRKLTQESATPSNRNVVA